MRYVVRSHVILCKLYAALSDVCLIPHDAIGLISYRAYWKDVILHYLEKHNTDSKVSRRGGMKWVRGDRVIRVMYCVNSSRSGCLCFLVPLFFLPNFAPIVNPFSFCLISPSFPVVLLYVSLVSLQSLSRVYLECLSSFCLCSVSYLSSLSVVALFISLVALACLAPVTIHPGLSRFFSRYPVSYLFSLRSSFNMLFLFAVLVIGLDRANERTDWHQHVRHYQHTAKSGHGQVLAWKTCARAAGRRGC